jgi:hypothetical protein
MALTNAELKEAVALLKAQAEEQAKISNSLEGYIEGLKKAKAIDEEVKRLKEIQNKILKKANTLYGQAKQDELDKLDLLKKQTDVLEEQGKVLRENLKEVNKTNLLISKGAASLAKGFANLPKLIENAYGKLKSSGLFEMDKAVRKSALSMGLVGERSKAFSDNVRAAAKETSMIGVGMQDLAKMQGDYSEALGRNVMLGESGLKAMGALAAASGLGAEGTAKMAADMEQQGYSAERTKEFVEQTMNDSSKMGLNASKVVKNIQQNIKMLNKYNFKGGVKGLAKMAETTSKLGVDMNFATGMADKLFDIEGAVEMSSQLQVLGGGWAKLADPFHLMYMARNDMAGLVEEIGQAAESQTKWNAELGDFEISSMEMHRLRKVAEQTGIAYEELATAGKNAAKFTKIKSQVGFAMDKDAKEFLTNTATLDEKGRAKIEVVVDGKRTTKFLSELKASDVTRMMGEKKTLEERAKESQTFDESLTNFINGLKVSLLPLIDEMNAKLIPKLGELAEWLKTSGWIDKIETFAKKIGELIATVGGWIIDNPLESSMIFAATKIAGFLIDKAGWILNGLALAKGFNMGTGGGIGGGTGQMGGKAMGMRNSAAMSRAGMSTMGKVGANFKGGLGSNLLKLGGVVAGLTTAYSEYNENSEKGMDTTENAVRSGSKGVGAGLGAWGGAAAGAAIGSVVPVVGTIIGGLIGGALGAWGGGALGEEVGDVAYGKKVNDAILSRGKITPIDNKDDLLAMKPNGAIDKVMNQGGGEKTMKIEFGEIHFKFDDLVVTSPGGPGLAIDIMNNPTTIRELTQIIQNETQKALKGGRA